MGFQNLACHEPRLDQIERTDAIVEEELFVAGIEIVRHSELRPRSEVPTHVSGKLGRFTFERSWRYWVTEGDVPLAIAQAMYEQQPYGHRDVRVAGHAGAPPPETPWLAYRAPDGKKVHLLRPGTHDRDLVDRYRAGTLKGTGMHEPIGRMLTEGHFVETEAEFERMLSAVVVEQYHIDSLGGLRVFADAVRGL